MFLHTTPLPTCTLSPDLDLIHIYFPNSLNKDLLPAGLYCFLMNRQINMEGPYPVRVGTISFNIGLNQSSSLAAYALYTVSKVAGTKRCSYISLHMIVQFVCTILFSSFFIFRHLIDVHDHDDLWPFMSNKIHHTV